MNSLMAVLVWLIAFVVIIIHLVTGSEVPMFLHIQLWAAWSTILIISEMRK